MTQLDYWRLPAASRYSAPCGINHAPIDRQFSITFLGADGASDQVAWPIIPRVGDHVALGVPPGSGISGTVVTVNWQQGSDGDPVVFIEVRE